MEWDKILTVLALLWYKVRWRMIFISIDNIKSFWDSTNCNTHNLHNMVKYKWGDNLRELYKKSLQMIKELNIKRVYEYNKILKEYSLLNVQSLKYISQKDDFTEIVKLAKEV